MKQQNQLQYVELDAERMIRKGAIRRTIRPARLWTTAFILSIVLPLGGLAVFLRLSVKSNNSLFIGIAEFWFFAFLIPLYFIGSPLRRAKESYRDAVLQSYGPLALGTRFTDLQIRQGSGVSWGTVASTRMINPGQYLDSKSILRGRYRGIPFEQSEIRAITIVRKLYRHGPRDVEKTVFRGQWMVLTLSGGIQPDRQTIGRCFPNRRGRQSRFVNGELHIAVHTRREAFSPPSVFLPFREEKAVAQIQREIAPFTRLIDELSLDNDLFKREDSI